jgi:hypothetical protein
VLSAPALFLVFLVLLVGAVVRLESGFIPVSAGIRLIPPVSRCMAVVSGIILLLSLIEPVSLLVPAVPGV